MGVVSESNSRRKWRVAEFVQGYDKGTEIRQSIDNVLANCSQTMDLGRSAE